jgi:histone deacetylase 6
VVAVAPPFYSPIFYNHVINANNLGKPKVGVIFDEEMILHKNHKDYHPERPERVMAIYLNLIKKGIYKELTQLDFEPAEDKHLEYVHPMSHIQKVKDTIYSVNTKNYKELLEGHKNTKRFQNDTYENKHTATSAYLAAGGTIEGVRAVLRGEVDSAFCIVRPPGHHASCSNVAGFCFFNNVAVAARYAQRELGKKKVCIFDWDVHVGDGTS